MNKSEIVLVIDRSGSMNTIKKDMELGLKNYLEEQKKLSNNCVVTLYSFDNVTELHFEAKLISDVEPIIISPRGMTALLDAVGKAMQEVGKRLSDTKESDRPETVLFLIVTDGAENASQSFTSQKIKEMIKHQEEKYSWKFVFLGANMDAVATAATYGIQADSVNTKSFSFAPTSGGIASSFRTASLATSGARCSVNYSISVDDRSAALDQK